MNIYTTEIIDAHIAIEAWLGRGEGDGAALMARFSDAFTMITPGGATLDKPALVNFFSRHSARRARGLAFVWMMSNCWQSGKVARCCATVKRSNCRISRRISAGQRWYLRKMPGSLCGGICMKRRLPGSRKEKRPVFTTGLFDEKGCLFAEQRFDIQPLRLQNFAQTTQTFNLNLANTFTSETNFTAYIFECRSLITQQTETTCQHFTLFGVQFEQPFDDALFHIIVLRGVFRAVVFLIGQDVQQRFFRITAQRRIN